MIKTIHNEVLDLDPTHLVQIFEISDFKPRPVYFARYTLDGDHYLYTKVHEEESEIFDHIRITKIGLKSGVLHG